MYRIIIQRNVDKSIAPSSSLIRKWASYTLKQHLSSAELTIRIVDMKEMTELNETYRHKKGPTNVLSFPLILPDDVKMKILPIGDIVICAEVVNKEAIEQHKSRDAHWAHMVVHGIFHLLGYDHETDREAEKMEQLEITIMQALNFANPYQAGETLKHHE